MRIRLLVVLLTVLCVGAVAQADVVWLQGVYVEGQESGLALAARLPVGQLPGDMKALGLYVIAPVVRFDDGADDVTLGLDRLNLRYGGGAMLGGGGTAVHAAVAWKLSLESEDLKRPILFISHAF